MTDSLPRGRVDELALDRGDSAPRYLLIEEDIRTQISDATLMPGDRLRTETALAEFYGVARSVIRQALDNLERDGLIERLRAKGTFICEPRLALPTDLLASFAQELDLHGIAASSRVLTYEMRPATSSIASFLAVEEQMSVFYIERLRLGDGEVLGWDATWVHPSFADELTGMDFERDVLFDSYRAAGRAAHSVDRRIRSVNAMDDVAAKIEVRPGAALLEIVRFVRDANGAPLDHQVRLYRGDRFSLALDATNEEPSGTLPLNPRLRFDG